MKKHISTTIAAIMAISVSTAIPVTADEPVSFTIFNSKTEIQEYLEEAAAYGEEHNVEIEVYYTNDTVAAHLATRYAASDPYTLSMTDAKDIYSVGAEYGYDMTGQDWTADTDYAITVDGKVLGFPVCIEARGMLYNADAIKAVTGEDFDPSSITTLDDFAAFCNKLVESGMETPTAILKPDWSLAAHYLQQVYEQREAASDFLNWLVYSEEGQALISETCGMVSAFSDNNVACSNDLGTYVKQYVHERKLVPNYNYDPDDHYSILGANMQEYLAGRIDRETLAQDIEAYWSSVTPVVH